MTAQRKPDRDCPACKSEQSLALEKYSQDEWRVVSCADCDFVYLKNPPGYEALIEDYAWEKTSVQETERRIQTRGVGAIMSKKSHWRLRLFSFAKNWKQKYFNEGNVLDIGCGFGGKLLDTDAVPFGVEISKAQNDQANILMNERGGYSVHAPAVEGVKEFPDEHFDSVLMHSFLEHEESPAELLAEVHRILKPGGKIYVRVPNYSSLNRHFMGSKWCGFRYPDHVNYFTLTHLKNMASKAGYGLKLLNPLNLAFDDNIKALLVKP